MLPDVKMAFVAGQGFWNPPFHFTGDPTSLNATGHTGSQVKSTEGTWYKNQLIEISSNRNGLKYLKQLKPNVFTIGKFIQHNQKECKHPKLEK